jgi:hypothetical protein
MTMPETENGHTELFWARVDSVILEILKNPRYLESNRSKELSSVIADQFKCSKRTAQRLIKEARVSIGEIGQEKKTQALEKAVRRNEYLWAKAIKKENEDLKLANEINKEYARLNQLYVENINATGRIEVIRRTITGKADLNPKTSQGE